MQLMVLVNSGHHGAKILSDRVVGRRIASDLVEDHLIDDQHVPLSIEQAQPNG